MIELTGDASTSWELRESESRRPSGSSSYVPSRREILTPSTANSTSDTISTTDENAHRCEEWELFSHDNEGSARRSLSEPMTDRSWESPRSSTGSDQGESNPIATIRLDEEEFEYVRSDSACLKEGPTCDTSLEMSEVDEKPTVETLIREDPPHGEINHPSSSEQCLAADSARSSTTTERMNESDAVSGRIQVLIRVRPPSRAESQGELAVTTGEAPNSLRVHVFQSGTVMECGYDRVFTERSTQAEIYEAVETNVSSVLSGFNATIFAYGQTGTGKTHTIFGDDSAHDAEMENLNDEGNAVPEWGLIPRILSQLVSRAKQMREEQRRVELRCSFIQIYNDRLFDLLTDRKRQKPLVIREQPTLDGGTNVVIQGLSSVPIYSLADALHLVRRGRANRSVRETELNTASSRSHAIVQISIETESQMSNGEKINRSSRLNLVDLAGSEKWNTDLEMEDRHSLELKNINSSLSALGNCIAALAESGRKHIPYRDSTLTRVLQDSFGGNTQSCLIATVSPAKRACEETMRTLQFADRARSVMQFVRVNETVSGSSELLLAKAQIIKLRQRLESEQRRRQATRQKELESLQRVFEERLQAKDVEIVKLMRDNGVYAKWREEDTAKIRLLEGQLKEVSAPKSHQVVQPMDQAQNLETFDLNHSQKRTLEFHQEQNEARFQPVASHTPARESHPRESSETSGKMDKSRVKSYQSLLERYALGSRKGHKPSSNTPTHKTLSATRQATNSKAAAVPVELSSPDQRSCMPRSTSDTIFTQAPAQLPVIDSPPPRIIQPDAWRQWKSSSDVTSGVAVFMARPSDPESVYTQVMKPAMTSNVWGSRQNVQDTSLSLTRLPTMAHTGETLLSESFSSPAIRQLPSMSHAQYRAQLEEPPKPEPTAPDPMAFCSKHRLKGCVLCAITDNRPIPQATATASKGPVPPDQPRVTQPMRESESGFSSNTLCDRHRLPGCFLCTKPGSFSMVHRTQASSDNQYCEDPPSRSLSGSRNDVKCPSHALANCVLCTGAKARPPQVESPVKAPFAIPESTFSAFRSNQQPHEIVSGDIGMASATKWNRLVPSTAMQAENQPLSSQGRSIPEPAALYSANLNTQSPMYPSPVKSMSSVPLHSSQSLVHEPITRNSLSMDDSSSYPVSQVARRSIKELATDHAGRKQFQALVREASDAASIALRRRG